MTIYRHCVVLPCGAATATMAQTTTSQINGIATTPFGAVVSGRDVPPGICAVQIRNVPGWVDLARQGPLLQCETAELETVIENKQNRDLPLNGTNNRKMTHRLTVNPGSHSEAEPPVPVADEQTTTPSPLDNADNHCLQLPIKLNF